ncbi:MAG: hypothetical protein HKN05_07680 [Rhizobiales bacterium]|nr:hypothetical protein [Hyphomicrobiales bacterium]
MAKPLNPNAYSQVSIIAHWAAALLIVALFFTHEGDRGSISYTFHVSGGALAGLFLLWRVWHRWRRGFAENPNQHALLALVSKLVLWGFLAATVIVVVSGYLLPWTLGKPLDLFGVVSVPAPVGEIHILHELMEKVHDAAGHLFVPLLALHLLGAAKHALIDKDDVASRIFKPARGGR